MKTIYSLFISASLFFTIGVSAQCTITSGPTVTPNGLMISVTGTGTGAAFPTYVYDWGDQTSPGISQTSTHTYAAAGTYTLCMYYVDGSNTSCLDSSCIPVTVVASGIQTNDRPQMEVSAMPNPFSVATSISVTLSQPVNVNITVYDITGQEVAIVYNGMMSNGQHTIQWKPDGMANGIYFLQIKAGDIVTARKIVYDNGN
jgi:hypothetical protein